MKTPWTKLTGYDFWDDVKDFYGDSRRDYHNFDHIEYMYRSAEALNIPYNRALDLAILFHDIIYDHLPNKESRSIAAMCQILPGIFEAADIGKAAYYIGTTENHSFEVDDPTLVVLDLYAFTDKEEYLKNLDKIISEAEKINHLMKCVDFRKSAISFIHELWQKLSNEKFGHCPILHKLGREILNGMKDCIESHKNVAGEFDEIPELEDILYRLVGSSEPTYTQIEYFKAYRRGGCNKWSYNYRRTGTTSAFEAIAIHAAASGKDVLFLTRNASTGNENKKKLLEIVRSMGLEITGSITTQPLGRVNHFRGLRYDLALFDAGMKCPEDLVVNADSILGSI